MSEIRYLTVSALNKYIGFKIDTDINLKLVYIQGELSNVRSSKGHLYFVLKDEESEISGIIFSNIYSKLNQNLKDGMKVLITGSINSYYKKGNYSLQVSKIEEFGQGLIYQKYLELKEKLEKLGMFEAIHKKKLKEFNFHIGVVTSETGDAFKDITSTIEKRFPLARIYLYKALCQGNDAPKSLISALEKAYQNEILDCIIIGRGGGSFEDLNCFNDENLAHTVFKSKIPVISCVGHENDYTIIDFVSDYRAPTPTGAGVIVSKDKTLLIENLNTIEKRIKNGFNQNCIKIINEYNRLNELLNIYSPINLLKNYSSEVINLEKRLELFNFEAKINNYNDMILEYNKKLESLVSLKIKNCEYLFTNVLDKLILVNPLNIMKKGYSLVYKDNLLVSSSNNLKKDDIIDIHFHDGKILAKVEGK